MGMAPRIARVAGESPGLAGPATRLPAALRFRQRTRQSTPNPW